MVGYLAGGIYSGLLQRAVAIDEDGEETEAAAELNVGPGVADHDAGFADDVWEACAGLIEKPGERLAAGTFILIVRAEEKGVDMSSVRGQFALEGGVDGLYAGGRIEAEGDATLVGDDDDAKAGAVEAGDGLVDAGEGEELARRGDIAAFGQLLV